MRDSVRLCVKSEIDVSREEACDLLNFVFHIRIDKWQKYENIMVVFIL